MAEFRARIEGIDRVRAAMSDPELIAGPVRRFLQRASLAVWSKATQKAPVDTGRLRGSIGRRIEPLRAVVGTNLSYAPDMEFGMPPHWPPEGSLQPWARRHGFPPGPAGDFIVRRIISKKGVKAQPFMLPALNESQGDIQRYFDLMAGEIEQRWQSHG